VQFPQLGTVQRRYRVIMSAPGLFTRFSHHVAHLAGKPITFAAATTLIVIWAVSGPIFQFSETWQLVVNTATTIITFLMVFVLQNTQNRDGEAVQAKLDELIYAVREADNAFVQAEKLSDEELHALRETLLKQCADAEGELTRRGHVFEPSGKSRTSEPA
jgi:low affinity Fe/Cu permease